MTRAALLLTTVCCLLIASCSSPERTKEEIEAARKRDPYTRSIDKSREIAGEATARADDEALH